MRYGYRRGKSSEGVNRVAGNDLGDLCPLPLGADGTGHRPSRNAANPRSVAGCNKPAPSRAEKTVMVVRNHEGGTSPAAGTVGPKGASASGSGRERGISAEGRYPNESQESRRRREPTRRSFERSGREVKVTRAGARQLRPPGDDKPGKPSKARPATAESQGGCGEGQTIRYQTIRLSNEFLNCSVGPEDHINPMRAARQGPGHAGIESALKTL